MSNLAPPESPMPDQVLRQMLGLSAQLQRFDKIIHAVAGSKHPIADVLLALLWSAAQTCDSLNKLCFYGKVRDCFALARCAWETLLNVCFIYIEGQGVADKARRHALQKSYRDLTRKHVLGNLSFGAPDGLRFDPSKVPGLAEAIAEYTRKSGRETTEWIDVSIDDRLALVMQATSEKGVVGLFYARSAIYRHASDILHGTLYGAAFALGMTQPTGGSKDFKNFIRHHADNLVMLLLMVQMSVHDVIALLGPAFGQQAVAEESLKEIKDIDMDDLFPKKQQ